MNDEGLVAVNLYGPIAEKYGHQHHFDISTPAEAIAALDANFPGFITDFSAFEMYYIHADGDWVSGETAPLLPVGREVHFVPHIEGRAFLGPALVGALLGISATTFTAQILGSLLVLGLMVGLSFLIKPKKPKEVSDKQKTESYSFSGPENVTEQGVAVPLVYGRVYCGSVVVSAGLEVNDEPSTVNGGIDLPGGPAMSPSYAPPYPGGFPSLTGSGSNRHPSGWVFQSDENEDNEKIWKPSPQPVPGWFYWWWGNEASFSPDGYFVTRATT